jgi:hypothetical protein
MRVTFLVAAILILGALAIAAVSRVSSTRRSLSGPGPAAS